MNKANWIRTIAVAALATAAMAPMSALAAQAPLPPPSPAHLAAAGPQPAGMPNGWVLHTVAKDKLYWVETGVPNMGIIIGNTSVILLDVGSNGKDLSDLVAKITNKPIKYVIETHGDTDHINGLYTLPNADKMQIIATYKNWREQWAVTRNQLIGITCPASPMPPMPNVIMRKDKVDTHIDGVHLIFHYFGPAHSGGDLILEVPDYKLAFVGDVIMGQKDMFAAANPGLPGQDHNMFWKWEKEGTPLGMFHSVEELMKTPVTKFVSGHGMTEMTRDEVMQVTNAVKADYQKAAAMALAGKTLEETKEAMGDNKYQPRGGCIKYGTLAWYAWNETMFDKNGLK